MERLSFRRCVRIAAGAAITVALGAVAASAQSVPQKGTKTVRASAAYDRSGPWRWLFGDAWRDVWSAEITVPVLDLDRYAGGLTPVKAGGNQSRTLRFRGGDGHTYLFRSTAKHFNRTLPGDEAAEPVGGIAQDLTAVFHPTPQLVVAALQSAVGLLNPTPRLVVLPDDPRLGKFREEFAGVLGQIEERPDENGNGHAFASADKVLGTEKFMARLEETNEDILATREYLTARLVDIVVSDTDRGNDQWRWAKFERGKHDVYRPVPRDRDYAFMKFDGPLYSLAHRVHPKLVRWGPEFPKLKAFTFMTRSFDRSHLVSLSRDDWDSTVAFVQKKLTDDAIDRAVRKLPAAHREQSGDEIAAGLRARRDALPGIARDYYRLVNHEADIFATDDDERAEIHRHPDGRVVVRLWRAPEKKKPDALPAGVGRPRAERPFFERTFVPGETEEVRVYLERGHDHAVVRGGFDGRIVIRVVGGEGDDVLADSSSVTPGTSAYFYDAHGENLFVVGAKTRVDCRPFELSPPVSFDEDVAEEEKENPRILSEERRGRFLDRLRAGDEVIDVLGTGMQFWGKDTDWVPATGYRESGGVLLGFGPTFTRYGFRHRPHVWSAGLRGYVGLDSGEFGAQLTTDRYFENSPWSLSLLTHATQLESNRFYGYGNDTPWIDADLSMVERFEVLVRPSFACALGEKSTLAFGPLVKYVEPEVRGGSPADLAAPSGTEPFGQAGLFAHIDLDFTTVDPGQQHGFGVATGGSAYPSAWDVEEPFGEAHALARVFIPLRWPTLALRAGGQRTWGDFPLHEAAFIGGRWTLRGYRWNRFAGDTSAYGAAELRMPVARVTLVTRGQLGVIGFADAGRVWMDGDSPGGWHGGYGGGLWFSTLGHEASFTYAYGEQSRLYFYVGLPF